MSSGPPTTAQSASEPEAVKSPGTHVSDRLRRGAVQGAPWFIALCTYIVAAVITTWPVAADPGGTVFGAPGDSTGNITLLRYRNELGVGPLSNAVTPNENAPFGISLPGAISLPQIVVEGPAQLVAAVTRNAVVAYNLAIIAGLVLTALACFALCRYVSGSSWAAGVAGLAYGFNPWIIERAHGHVHFTHLWSLPLIVLGLLLIRRGGGWRGWILFIGALIAACYTNTYISLFAGTILAAFVVADVGAAAIRRDGGARLAVGRACFAFAALVAVMLPQAIVSVTQAAKIDGLLAGSRSPTDVYAYSSRWWEWFIPSYRHPIFGEWTGPYLLERQHGSNVGETAIYLGSTMIALAMVGFVVSLLAWRRRRPSWVGGFAAVLIAAGLVVSLPKEVSPLGFDIPMPSYLLSSVVEPWRVYSRLFTVVMLGIALLAALGLARILRPLPRPIVPVAAAALAALVAFDMAVKSTTFSARTPPVYEELARQGGDAARVEYPIVPPVYSPHLSYIFYTAPSGRPLMNGGRPGTAGGSFNMRLTDPSQAATASTLAALDVRWVVIHRNLYPGGSIPELGRGFSLVAQDEPSLLYRVTADPAPVVAVPAAGFGLPEPDGAGRFAQWMEAREGEIAVLNSTDRQLRVGLSFSIGSFNRPRTATITRGDDVLARKVIRGQTSIAVRTTVPPGLSTLGIHTEAGLDSIGEALGNDDPRTVSLRVGGIRAKASGAPAVRVG